MNIIVLGRDGVINEASGKFIKSPDEWKPLPGSLEAIAGLNKAGWRVTVATNQSGIARGLFDVDTLNAIHHKMYEALNQVGGQIDGIFFCPHSPVDNCRCRKPRPGMLEQIGERFFARPEQITMIGDTQVDVEAARAYGAKPILVGTTVPAADPRHGNLKTRIPVFTNLAEAVESLLHKTT